MTLNDSSSLILIVGAIAILAFVVHGLWFSGRSINRKLVKGSKEDQEIALSNAVGKVRIVKPKEIGAESDFNSVNVKHENYSSKPDKVEPVVSLSTDFSVQEKDPKTPENTYELNLFASDGRPYRGLDLEELFNSYGILKGEKDIYCVYENPQLKDKVVFRLCSLESPYAFPENMESFSTSSLALYMQLPKKGKAFLYFRAMHIAAKCLVEHLGGVIKDNNNREMTDESLEETELLLKKYDKSEEEE